MSNTSIIAYIVLTIAIAYSFIYPAAGDLSALLGEKQKYDDTLSMVNNIEVKKNELLAEFNNISAAEKKDIETLLPDSFGFVRLVSQIDAVAAKYGISIDKITSKETNSSSGGSIEGAESQKLYKSSTVGFSFDASYDKFNAFLDDLEKSLRILDIRYAKLNTGDKGIYTYNVEFETYWLK